MTLIIFFCVVIASEDGTENSRVGEFGEFGI
jgi:hypothetical protein